MRPPTTATAAVTFDGPAATITGVRFSHLDHCTLCRHSITVHTDGGTIRAGIQDTVTTHRGQRSQAPRWFTINEPGTSPQAPAVCPNCGADRPRVVNGFTKYQPTPDAQAHDLLRGVWVAIRRDFPELAADADRNERGAR